MRHAFLCKKSWTFSAVENALPEDFAEVIRMLEAGKFPVDDAVSAIVPPEEAAEMLADWSANPGKFTKIMVQFA